ncbi:MAG: circularly permuted type 2 ATP-grasp protein [Verrucomicrobiales bacterium]
MNFQRQRQHLATKPGDGGRAYSGEQKPFHEMLDEHGAWRSIYGNLMSKLDLLNRSELRRFNDRMDATLREMDITFNVDRTQRRPGMMRKPWECDLLPQIFEPFEWELIERGVAQRLRAFELFLKDIYGKKEILRSQTVPLRPILGSPAYLHAALGVPTSAGDYLHLCGVCLTRDHLGRLAVRSHHFTHASGIAYMMQNRRILTRVHPDLFSDYAVGSIAGTPLAILEQLRRMSPQGSKHFNAVLLTPGPRSAVFSEHTFLARRMGLQLVMGGDLVVLDDHLMMKTVGGLERVDLIYNRVAHDFLDPLVCRRDSLLGVPGLVHCLRKGTVSLVNSLGSELADDRSLLSFANQIIRFYLGEQPIIPTISTYWLGDIDQREMVLADLGRYRIRSLHRQEVLGHWRGLPASGKDEQAIRQTLRRNPQHYVAQTVDEGANTLCLENGTFEERLQDHMVFAFRSPRGFELVPGALTQVSAQNSFLTGFENGGTSKDTWVLRSDQSDLGLESLMGSGSEGLIIGERKVTSRVAESFYWLGRYLERMQGLTGMIATIESLELEELTASERKLYRPIWSRVLPPLEDRSGRSRALASKLDRYKLLLHPDEPDSAASLLRKACFNAESIMEALSPECWSILAELRMHFERVHFRQEESDLNLGRATKKLTAWVDRLVPQFYATLESTTLGDEGRHLCDVGRYLERALITANAVLAIQTALHGQLARSSQAEHATEIELSAFLRLLGSRDSYRRVYQMRAQPLQVLQLLWQNPEAPRSAFYCLTRMHNSLREAGLITVNGNRSSSEAIESSLSVLAQIDWAAYLDRQSSNQAIGSRAPSALGHLLSDLYTSLAGLHVTLSDSFFSHQAAIQAD